MLSEWLAYSLGKSSGKASKKVKRRTMTPVEAAQGRAIGWLFLFLLILTIIAGLHTP